MADPASTARAEQAARRALDRRARRITAAIAAGICAAVLLLDRVFPPPLPRAGADGALVVLAADGTPLRTYPSRDGVWRVPVRLDAVSPLYVQALVGYEDRAFWQHPGVNPLALARAGWQWARNGRVVSGGSTLTMQVARLLEPPAPGARRSLATKLRQAVRAMQIEARLGKREILELYLNRAPMGGMVEGVEMASRAYLGKPARELSAGEAALLAVLPQAPSRLRPDRAPAAARAARDKLLARMQASGAWDAATVADARIETIIAQPIRAHWLAPLAAERLRQQARPAGAARGAAQSAARDAAGAAAPAGSAARATTERDASGREVLRTTLDAGIQRHLEQLLLDRLGSLPAHVSIAALVVENATLAVRGYAGSADFGDASRAAHVDMVRAVRSPGSTLKPFLYALALDEGLIHSESLLIDAPQDFGGYAPGNFQAAFSGPVSVSEALQRSLNVPAVDLLDRLGPARFAGTLRNAGLRLRMPGGAEPNLSLILGGGGTTLEELVGAYTAFARGGIAGRPRFVPDAPVVETRLMSPGAAFIVREILENGGKPDRPFNLDTAGIAWKTGTSFGFRDAWAVAVTDAYTVGVWVGRPDGTPNPGHFGANTSAPLVRDLMLALPRAVGAGPDAAAAAASAADAARGAAPDPARTTAPGSALPGSAPPGALVQRGAPPGVVAADICWPGGLAASQTEPALCRERRRAWTLDGATPPTLPDRLRSGGWTETLWIDRAHQRRLRPDCLRGGADGATHANAAALASSAVAAATPAAPERIDIPRWPTLLDPWLAPERRAPEAAWPWADGCRPDAPQRTLHIEGLDPGATLRPAPGKTAAVLALRAVGARASVVWLLDDRVVASAPAAQTVSIAVAEPGPHRLAAIDAEGRFATLAFRWQDGAR
ncbi:penicillin-binding protein 1C [Derxia lacustris]|uniref:penicillin-binding protein 1C n=1 Tax=Derxia lacustris TaxID=764842 RepID=UPI000A16DA68